MDGWRRMGLDDAFPIRQVLPVGARARFWCWAHWAGFFIVKNVYFTRYNAYIFIKLFYVGLRGNGCVRL